jgi:hypothetical protein
MSTLDLMSTRDQPLASELHGTALLLAQDERLQPLLEQLAAVAAGRDEPPGRGWPASSPGNGGRAPPVILIRWPAAPSVTDARRFAAVAAAITTILAEARAALARHQAGEM